MNTFTRKITSIIFLLAFPALSFADDTDFINIDPPVNSNVLFIMDMSGSMEKDIAGSNPPLVVPAKSRKDVLHEALKTVLNDPTLLSINVGIMSFSGYEGASETEQKSHGITYPISSLAADAQVSLSKPTFTHSDTVSYLPNTDGRTTIGYISDVVPTTWTPKGGTPIVDSLYEAARYFRGDSVFYGRYAPEHKKSAHPSTYIGELNVVPTEVITHECDTVSCSDQTSCATTSVQNKTVTPGSVSCTTTDVNVECHDNACRADVYAAFGSCDPITTGRIHCGTVPSQSSPTLSCGTGVNCANELYYTASHYCPVGADLSACLSYASSQGWNVSSGSCSLNNVTGSCHSQPCPGGVNDAGICENPLPDVCDPDSTRYVCAEDIYETKCDADVSSCRKPETSCEHEICGDVTRMTYPVIGTADYKTPITDECSKNRIVLLSDGAATLNSSANNVTAYIDSKAAGYTNNCSAKLKSNGDPDMGRCGKELTKFLANEDNIDNNILPGDQFINTYTIGFALNASTISGARAMRDMSEIATEGGGQFLMASTPASLATALRNSLIAQSEARSFSSPTYTSNVSSMANSDFVFLPVFDKGAGPIWSGNLKKFKRVDGVLKDKNNLNAVTPVGSLLKTSKDYWDIGTASATNAIEGGGVANLIDPATRTIYTDNGVGPLTTLDVSLSNSLFEKTSGTVNNAYKEKLVSFIKGYRADGVTPRYHLGDIIHSKPVHIKIGTKDIMFVGTNEGYLHAFDVTDGSANDGKEIFAYMPQELLKNIEVQYSNDLVNRHPYGVDGKITVWHDDLNNNEIVESGEKVILYFGLRRGGKSYYAVEVTNPSSPRLVWKIDDTQLANLGFTWSQPVVSKMRVGATEKRVLIFGGGYIDDNGVLGTSEIDDGSVLTGTGVFIVNADNGHLIKKISPNKKYAIPARIRVLDTNRNGLADKFYFGDTGGYIWRVDFTGEDTMHPTVTMFADLSDVTAPATKQRKFFAEPDVATFRKGGNFIASLSIGSGERPKPMDMRMHDNFFVLFDKRPFGTPLPTITMADLYEKSVIPAGQNALSGGKKGWYMKLDFLNGEKVLSRAMTYQNIVLFSTFGTTTITVGACENSNVNQSMLYALDLLNGRATLNLDGAGGLDEHTMLTREEIPDATQVIFNELRGKDRTSACKRGDCVQPTDFSTGKGFTVPGPANTLNRVFWIDEE